MTARKSKSASGEVGYGKPPRHTRFRKGQSGNPHGRPSRLAQSLKALTLHEAYRGVVIKREDGIGMPAYAIQAILRSQVELASQGNVQAQRAILAAVQRYETEDEYQAWLAAIRRPQVPPQVPPQILPQVCPQVYGHESGISGSGHETDSAEQDVDDR